ncbi:hypothetical protein ACSQ6I_10235 [Anabaena sp. WFMT]|uniref:hypothetical protein n=1 Tax=Anabaena sp. WFMT TaxID=3449730 RepID=UPI003F2206BB
MHKKPHTETTITQNLCSLLDQEEQSNAALHYSFLDLQKDLSEYAGGLKVSFSLETHEYNSAVENRITQSDMGIIINYLNYYEPDISWSESWLFQAKSLKPSKYNPLEYTESSTFDSISQKQLLRIKNLVKIINIDFIKFMEYCPRLNLLKNKWERNKLISYRDLNLAENIFDYALGIELHDCILKADPSLEPGIFISSIYETSKTKSYLDVYKKFWTKSHPFSWFILSRLTIPRIQKDYHQYLVENRVRITPENPIPQFGSGKLEPAIFAHSIVRCDREATNYLLREIDKPTGDFQLYPARTLSIDISVGGD